MYPSLPIKSCHLCECDPSALHEEYGLERESGGLDGERVVLLVVLGLHERPVELVPHPEFI